MSRILKCQIFGLIALGFCILGPLSGCGGGGDVSTPVQEDTQKTQDRENMIKDMYSKKAKTPRR